ncbi:ATP-dependent DNA ligase [Streptomyces sp. NPDC005438]|uniref:ATP-dependent DNA ligase n=1 Tax=Streptomyces sp. NPDC005438 TaxID=3156880 RepID=UPI0033BC81A0
MDLPVTPPVKPMLARPAARIPPGMHYEAKWDGFRALVFRDGERIEIASRTTKPLNRYFPELERELAAHLPERCVVDGEIVIARDGRLDFDALLERIHPAESRVRALAERTPASFVTFDLLALGDHSWMARPQSERRAELVRVLDGTRAPVHLAPATRDVELARRWFAQYEGAGLDGVVAKPLASPYEPDRRQMVKVKHERTADCVVAGLRHHKSGPVVGSLLLGLHDERGVLQHVGVCASFTTRRRAELMEELAPLVLDPEADHPWSAWRDEAAHAAGRMPGGPSRWNAAKDLSWVPLRPERVCEVAYDHMQGDRFRHTTRFRRWRPDRDPGDCDYRQLEEPVNYRLEDVLGA